MRVHVPDDHAEAWPTRIRRQFDLLAANEVSLRESVAAKLWTLYDRSWRDDEDDRAEDPDSPEPATNALDLGRRFALYCVEFWSNGTTSLYYRDGHMFLGHTVMADLDEHLHLTAATLAG